MAERGRHRVAPIPAPTKRQYAYVPCPRSEEVGTELALQLLRSHSHDEPETPQKSPPEVLRVSWKSKVSNTEVLARMQKSTKLLKTTKQRKVSHLGHILRKYDRCCIC
ncbi:uncharacterized protein LOC119191981 [Manduca sexta]|uniref:uncharacterized protein LOC119191981 n=1 Tax=Manduca sexta TaxID=7130 RepID=UPI00188E13F1|nr:uncharacterized protein LOC119191981 [Manduca sexta]